MKISKRLLAMLLSIVMILCVLPHHAGATDEAVTQSENYQTKVVSTEPAEEISCTSVEEIGLKLRAALKARQSEVTIAFEIEETYNNQLDDRIYEIAMEHTGVPTEGDYLRYNCGGYRCGFSYYQNGNIMEGTVTFRPQYYSTAAQEAVMDSEVAKLLNELNLWNASDYEKIVGVYEWMCQNITYDYENLGDPDYMLKYTSYAALVNRTSVCQGYASLLYRLLLELGVDNRMITGIGNGGGHAWNIVEIKDLYYDVDATWDASWRQAGLDYNFFLLPDAEFEDHERDQVFLTDSFMNEYPMATEAYQPALIGDTNLDGNVDSEDLTILARHVAGIELVTATAFVNADVNGDGEVDAEDLTLHARYIAGIIDEWDNAA